MSRLLYEFDHESGFVIQIGSVLIKLQPGISKSPLSDKIIKSR